jgi:hypothetical protein
MPHRDPRDWAPFPPFDPAAGTVIRRPPGQGRGYWAGAPGVTYDARLETFYLVYRLRRPRGVEPDRGAEIHIAASRDGIAFDDIWSGAKEQLQTSSIERCALVRRPDGTWRLYASFVDPADGRWQISLVEAEEPGRFELAAARPVLTAADIGAEGVKDPLVFRVAGLEHMIVSYATSNPTASQEELHGTQDAYNTGLIRSATGLATSTDGVAWRWEGPILSPEAGRWDAYAARISTLWYRSPVWLALYDGSASVEENYEECCGLAYSLDLRRFHRVTRDGPLFGPPSVPGAIRYFDVVALAEATYFYYEMAQPDGSHDLRVCRVTSSPR